MAVENDIVLIYMEDKPLVFARVEEILPDRQTPFLRCHKAKNHSSSFSS